MRNHNAWHQYFNNGMEYATTSIGRTLIRCHAFIFISKRPIQLYVSPDHSFAIKDNSIIKCQRKQPIARSACPLPEWKTGKYQFSRMDKFRAKMNPMKSNSNE